MEASGSEEDEGEGDDANVDVTEYQHTGDSAGMSEGNEGYEGNEGNELAAIAVNHEDDQGGGEDGVPVVNHEYDGEEDGGEDGGDDGDDDDPVVNHEDQWALRSGPYTYSAICFLRRPNIPTVNHAQASPCRRCVYASDVGIPPRGIECAMSDGSTEVVSLEVLRSLSPVVKAMTESRWAGTTSAQSNVQSNRPTPTAILTAVEPTYEAEAAFVAYTKGWTIHIRTDVDDTSECPDEFRPPMYVSGKFASNVDKKGGICCELCDTGVATRVASDRGTEEDGEGGRRGGPTPFLHPSSCWAHDSYGSYPPADNHPRAIINISAAHGLYIIADALGIVSLKRHVVTLLGMVLNESNAHLVHAAASTMFGRYDIVEGSSTLANTMATVATRFEGVPAVCELQPVGTSKKRKRALSDAERHCEHIAILILRAATTLVCASPPLLTAWSPRLRAFSMVGSHSRWGGELADLRMLSTHYQIYPPSSSAFFLLILHETIRWALPTKYISQLAAPDGPLWTGRYDTQLSTRFVCARSLVFDTLFATGRSFDVRQLIMKARALERGFHGKEASGEVALLALAQSDIITYVGEAYERARSVAEIVRLQKSLVNHYSAMRTQADELGRRGHSPNEPLSFDLARRSKGSVTVHVQSRTSTPNEVAARAKRRSSTVVAGTVVGGIQRRSSLVLPQHDTIECREVVVRPSCIRADLHMLYRIPEAWSPAHDTFQYAGSCFQESDLPIECYGRLLPPITDPKQPPLDSLQSLDSVPLACAHAHGVTFVICSDGQLVQSWHGAYNTSIRGTVRSTRGMVRRLVAQCDHIKEALLTVVGEYLVLSTVERHAVCASSTYAHETRSFLRVASIKKINEHVLLEWEFPLDNSMQHGDQSSLTESAQQVVRAHAIFKASLSGTLVIPMGPNHILLSGGLHTVAGSHNGAHRECLVVDLMADVLGRYVLHSAASMNKPRAYHNYVYLGNTRLAVVGGNARPSTHVPFDSGTTPRNNTSFFEVASLIATPSTDSHAIAWHHPSGVSFTPDTEETWQLFYRRHCSESGFHQQPVAEDALRRQRQYAFVPLAPSFNDHRACYLKTPTWTRADVGMTGGRFEGARVAVVDQTKDRKVMCTIAFIRSEDYKSITVHVNSTILIDRSSDAVACAKQDLLACAVPGYMDTILSALPSGPTNAHHKWLGVVHGLQVASLDATLLREDTHPQFVVEA
jgi:hypothetical protein